MEEETYILSNHQYELLKANEATANKEAYIDYRCIYCDYTKTQIIDNWSDLQIDVDTIRVCDRAFEGCSSLTSIELPTTITNIGLSAFKNCNNLTSITLPFVGNGSDQTHFGYIFGASSYYDNGKYVPTSLKEVIITGGTSIGNEAFNGFSSLTSITIPNSITNIGNYAFGECSNLEKVYYKGTIEDWCNISFSTKYSNPMSSAYHIYMLDENNEYEEVTEIVIPETITEIGNYQFCDFKNVTSIEIPNSVTTIGDSAFRDCIRLSSIEIPNSVTSIGEYAFYDCSSLTSIEIPNSVTSIGDRAFSYCIRLSNIEIPNSVTSIGEHAFYYCSSLTSIALPFGGNGIDEIHFKYIFGTVPSSLKEVIITGGTRIGYSAFSDCTSLTSIEIPNSVKSIGGSAFSYCSNLANVYYKGTIEDWCKISFSSGDSNPMTYASHIYMLNENSEYEEVTEIVIPETITEIGEYQFCDFKSITSITIPNSVISIGKSAFRNCSSLTSIEIPNSVTYIGWDAFIGCSNLTIYCEADSEPNGWDFFWNCDHRPVVWGYKIKRM